MTTPARTPVGQITARSAASARPETRTRLIILPTARGFGVLIVVATLVVLASLDGSRGSIALAAGLAAALGAAPVQAWVRARRAALGVHVFAHAVPPMVPVGGPSTLALTVVNASRQTIPQVGLERSEGHWRPVADPLPPGPSTPGEPTPEAFTSAVFEIVAGLRAPTPLTTEHRRALDLLAPSTLTLVRLPTLPPGGSTSVDFGVPTMRRGMYTLTPVRAWAHDAWGLFGFAVAVAPDVVVVVHPCRAADVPVPFTAAIGATAARAATAPVRPSDSEVGGEFADLRPYVPGDRLHLLHWPAYARYGTLLVRRFDPEVGGALRIVVDDRAGVHRRGSFEGALSTTLAIVAAAGDLGIPLELATLSGWRATVPPTPEGMAGVLPLLSTMRPRRARVSGQIPDWIESGSGLPTIVTTVTGEPRLPSALGQCTKVVVR